MCSRTAKRGHNLTWPRSFYHVALLCPGFYLLHLHHWRSAFQPAGRTYFSLLSGQNLGIVTYFICSHSVGQNLFIILHKENLINTFFSEVITLWNTCYYKSKSHLGGLPAVHLLKWDWRNVRKEKCKKKKKRKMEKQLLSYNLHIQRNFKNPIQSLHYL